MVAPNTNSTSHPIRVNYFGQAGVEAASLHINSKGFISSHASIATSGMNGGAPFANPIRLTSYGSTADAVKPNSVYSMTCKMIGTNNDKDDHLHFENSARIDLGDVARFGESFAEDLMDKTVMIALGYVTARETVKDPLYKGKATVVITLQSQDYDPIQQQTKIPVTFYTKHHIPPVRNMEKAQNICQVGREVQLVGAIKDYDGVNFMWETEVTAISRCTGDAPSLVDKVINKPGTPKGGRVPLTLNKASSAASTSANTLDPNPSSTPPVPQGTGNVIDTAVKSTEADENTEAPETPVNSSPLKRRRV
ncbi:uncharacterized protein MELLADRAFT_85321 [Melampsora larici-populina 98AG31]|uniref:Uncharacterized protein n=1 Tax=Melampsora larici-populina (strain 98AG31 / pathotype 3-4-7) TaxID=747676 RepID=F4RIC9_MELLP|nr:uncharacterized protein MELLADRAFT_85321 [Melampsora larici-populina 98AG31]EGG07989.1 hypothetical protein MELLADRAFT_85321 [Melampsora larici-populina 98AG31]